MPDVNKLQTGEPVLVTNGTLSAEVMTGTPTGAEAGLVVKDSLGGQTVYKPTDTYAVAALNGGVTLAIASTMSLAYLWHPAAVAKTYYLQRVTVTTDSGGGTAKYALRLTRISAENIAPGGTLSAPIQFNSASPASSAVFRAGANAPTRAGTDAYVHTLIGSAGSTNVFDAPDKNTPMVMLGGVAEGWEVRLENASIALNTMRIGVEFMWTEV